MRSIVALSKIIVRASEKTEGTGPSARIALSTNVDGLSTAGSSVIVRFISEDWSRQYANHGWSERAKRRTVLVDPS
jgi:hypothetical protein